MRTFAILAWTAGLLVFTAGCAVNSIVGHGAMGVGPYFGNVGMVGHNQTVTISRGSKVPKLSIQGNNCNVTVEDDAWVGKVEFLGNGNTVSIPADLLIGCTQIGANTIIRRPPMRRAGEEWPSYEETTTPPTPKESRAPVGGGTPLTPKVKASPPAGEKAPTEPNPVDAGLPPGGAGEEEQK